ncbi:MAG: hypothetical protein HN542_00315 [Flavobacteriales bacterium]|jgi:hypothetical protein|nr:hypothetical protein [Flavobacteriales bacterium]MBT3963363.1 hypothetical protein [Flavobacteriales bacterium]MBT4704487.1 hypothetical protein [Flavobacteriales bacterium]MBT4931242.1 hypothetical protein [Flavobacteriales bacterium]MBT5131981.1 hypothetical protein [Flavobacteriales bacterium]
MKDFFVLLISLLFALQVPAQKKYRLVFQNHTTEKKLILKKGHFLNYELAKKYGEIENDNPRLLISEDKHEHKITNGKIKKIIPGDNPAVYLKQYGKESVILLADVDVVHKYFYVDIISITSSIALTGVMGAALIGMGIGFKESGLGFIGVPLLATGIISGFLFKQKTYRMSENSTAHVASKENIKKRFN